MSVTVSGNDLRDIRQKIGERESTPALSVRWRGGDFDFGREELCGCIVKDLRARVPMEFKDAGSAVRYIAKILKEHDVYARVDIAKRKKEVAAHAKTAKKK